MSCSWWFRSEPDFYFVHCSTLNLNLSDVLKHSQMKIKIVPQPVPMADISQDLAKINQDRACVVHPFLGSDTCALLCVYDGHGERGGMVRRVTCMYSVQEADLPVRNTLFPRLVGSISG